MIKLFCYLLGINPPCIHDWKVLTKESVPSRIEVFRNDGGRGGSYQAFAMDMAEMCKKETIIILKCNKCGKLQKEYVTNDL